MGAIGLAFRGITSYLRPLDGLSISSRINFEDLVAPAPRTFSTEPSILMDPFIKLSYNPPLLKLAGSKLPAFLLAEFPINLALRPLVPGGDYEMIGIGGMFESIESWIKLCYRIF